MIKHVLNVCVFVVCFASLAQAEDANWHNKNDWYSKPYAGFDYQYTDLDTNFGGADGTLHGGNIHIGTRMHKYWGLELGYMMTEDGEATTALGTSNTSLEGGTLDLLGYLPVADNTELIGTIGISRINGEYDIPGVVSADDWETEARIGAGAQYWLSDMTNLRGLVRYQGADFGGTVDDATIASLGLNFQF